jgi:hypothetical protein
VSSEEIELAAKSIGAAVGALVEASGLLGPVKQLNEYFTKRIYYRQLPTLARVATLAAGKIERLGLPHASIDDPVVLRILEDSAGAQDETMQERWANLIANTTTASSQRHYVAYSRILAELEPPEAALLDSIADNSTFAEAPLTTRLSVGQLTETEGVTTAGVDNLIRLGVLRHEEPSNPSWEELESRYDMIANLRFTVQGWAFVQACREPEPPADDG